MVRLTLRLPVDSGSPAVARHCVESLERVLGSGGFDNVKLLVSELVTNSVRHGHLGPGDWVEIGLEAQDGAVRVDVRDPGVGFPPPNRPEPAQDATHGWGLYLVERLAPRWGVERTASATEVWFEITSPEDAVSRRSVGGSVPTGG